MAIKYKEIADRLEREIREGTFDQTKKATDGRRTNKKNLK